MSAAGVSTRSRAAASSIASGTLSSASQIATTCCRVVLGELEVGLDRTRTLDEQLGGLLREAADRAARSARRAPAAGSGWSRAPMPTTRRAALPSSGAASTTCSTLSSTSSTRRRPSARGELLRERPLSGVPDAQRVRHRRDHESGIQHRREVDEYHAVWERRLHRSRRLHREPALADPAGTGDGHEPLSFVRQHPRDGRELPVPARRAA